MSRQPLSSSALTPQSCTVEDLAKRLGLDRTSVFTGIRVGRLTKAVVGRNARGKLYILDLEAAVAEWEASARKRFNANGSASPSDLAAATVRERNARAEKFEIETERVRRSLVSAAEAERRWAAHVVGARTTLLGLPSRAKQRLPHLTPADLATLDRLIREALEELGETP